MKKKRFQFILNDMSKNDKMLGLTVLLKHMGLFTSGTTSVDTIYTYLHRQIMKANVAYGGKERRFGRDGKASLRSDQLITKHAA